MTTPTPRPNNNLNYLLKTLQLKLKNDGNNFYQLAIMKHGINHITTSVVSCQSLFKSLFGKGLLDDFEIKQWSVLFTMGPSCWITYRSNLPWRLPVGMACITVRKHCYSGEFCRNCIMVVYFKFCPGVELTRKCNDTYCCIHQLRWSWRASFY